MIVLSFSAFVFLCLIFEKEVGEIISAIADRIRK